ncbi:mitochondrial glyco protein [Glomus cerebriforme]|uniref:Mitochondrial glyco protein n=1 Tax=Glomus cerebriforme TaxID=658196 RepID=A0A397SI83_9GLOM|nr:mitochondrial glyco protein [Glomus cerebriforme]
MATASLLRANLLRSIRPIPTLTKVSSIVKTFPVTPVSRVALTRLNPSLPISRRFTATSFRLNAVPAPKDTQIDKDLAVKLEEELTAEKEIEKESEFIKTFLAQNPFKIEDKLGSNEVALTRIFGNEKISLMFDINTLDQQTPSFPVDEDEDELEETEDVEESEDESTPSLPVRCSINIEKNGKGALAIEAILADGVFLVNYVTYFNDAKLASDWTVEGDWKRRGVYPGPQFETLDNDVQVLFEKYLEERGINTAVAMFISSYVEYKEQKEYISWLKNVKKFVESP